MEFPVECVPFAHFGLLDFKGPGVSTCSCLVSACRGKAAGRGAELGFVLGGEGGLSIWPSGYIDDCQQKHGLCWVEEGIENRAYCAGLYE